MWKFSEKVFRYGGAIGEPPYLRRCVRRRRWSEKKRVAELLSLGESLEREREVRNGMNRSPNLYKDHWTGPVQPWFASVSFSTLRSRVMREWINPTSLIRLDDPGSISPWAWASFLRRLCILMIFLLYAHCCLIITPLFCPKIHIKIPKNFLCVLDNFLVIFVMLLRVKTW
jgi:hypothetical protein